MKLSAVGGNGKFHVTTLSQIWRHRRLRRMKLSALEKALDEIKRYRRWGGLILITVGEDAE